LEHPVNKEGMMGVFIKVKIWLCEQNGWRREGRGYDRVEEQGVEACSEMDVGEKQPQIRAGKGSHEMVVI